MTKIVTEVVRCDVCGVKPAKRLCFPWDRIADGAGSMEDVYYDVDLCDLHWLEVHRLLANYDEQPTRVSKQTMGRGDRRDFKQRIEGIIGAWEKMSGEEQVLTKQILRLAQE